MDPRDLHAQFQACFGRPATLAVRAPGRVNLIGEHTDYNQGWVLPMAINFQVVCLAAPRPDRTVRVYAREYGAFAEFRLDDPTPDPAQRWRNYVQGIAWALEEQGARLRGLDLYVAGDVPQGAGLSSSAAIEMSAGYTFLALAETPIDRVALALAGQTAENRFLGVRTGIMDQYISALAVPDAALCIDCRELTSEVVRLHLAAHGVAVVVVELGVQRGLVDSEYNARRGECEEGVRLFQALLPGRDITALRDVTEADLARYGAELPPLIRRRVRHVVTEDARVLTSVAALHAGDMATFGRLMLELHASMRDDYAITVPAIDRLIELSAACPGVLGARMTGGGFGGSTVHLVAQPALARFARDVVAAYEQQTGLDAPMYVCQAVGGVGPLERGG